jgi:hypothetical protein
MKFLRAGPVLALGVVLALAGTAGAQDASVPTGDLEVMEPNQNWGTTSNTIVTYEASDFELFFGVYGGYDSPTTARYCGAAATCGWLAGLKLPAGAIMDSVELDACDTDAVYQVGITVFKNVKGGGAQVNLAPFGGTGATPGCGTFVLTFPPETINNLNNNYYIDVISGPTSTTRFKAVRVNYRLQVSPGPATATFADVPTSSSYFKFVEALVSAGIVAGCGGGNYCPNNPVTRGQMAVFLSAALGMHFPN